MQTKKAILIIDDDEILLSALKTLLECDNFNVKTCSNAASAVDLASESQFDIYIIDYYLREIHGDAMAAAIRRMQPSAIIIGCSSQPKEHAFLSAGADTFIAKSDLPAQVSAFIRRSGRS